MLQSSNACDGDWQVAADLSGTSRVLDGEQACLERKRADRLRSTIPSMGLTSNTLAVRSVPGVAVLKEPCRLPMKQVSSEVWPRQPWPNISVGMCSSFPGHKLGLGAYTGSQLFSKVSQQADSNPA